MSRSRKTSRLWHRGSSPFLVLYCPVSYAIGLFDRNGGSQISLRSRIDCFGNIVDVRERLVTIRNLQLRYEELNAEVVRLSPLLSAVIMPASRADCLIK